MAKDPAFLFYSSDFLTGTILMEDGEIGRYIKLLCLQHQKGRLSKTDFFKIAKKEDNELIGKFTLDENGFYYNERLEIEYNKRIKHLEHQRANALMRWHKSGICGGNAKTMPLENENENENRNEDINEIENKTCMHVIKKPVKNKYGIYNHVLLTQEEHTKLVDKFGIAVCNTWINKLDEGIELKGYKYKNHYLAILKWAKNDHNKADTMSIAEKIKIAEGW